MEDKYSIKQMILIILIVIFVLGIFYGITILVTEKKNNKQEETKVTEETDVTIDYDTILANNIFSQSQDSYYVLASFIDDQNVSSYKSNLETYKNKDNSLKVYEVDLSSAFNKNYVSDESSFTNESLKFKETTLLKIENKQIAESYEGKDDITNFLSTLIGE